MNNPELGQVEAQSTFFDNALESLRNTRLGNMIAAGSIALTGAIAANVAQGTINPDKAEAAMECTTTTTTSPDGTTTSTQTECSNNGDSPDGESAQPEAEEPSPENEEAQPRKTAQERAQERREARQERREARRRQERRRQARKQRRINSQKDFRGYNMGDSSFTDGNGCFITAVASALRRETGNSKITPKRIYYPALRKRWSPSGGVNGFLFDALPSMAAKHKVKVRDTSYKGMVKAIKRGDEGLVLAAPGHFTAVGHYMAARRVTRNGRVILDDPNGRGRHGDSERRKGWSGKQLKAAGVIDYRVLHRKGVK